MKLNQSLLLLFAVVLFSHCSRDKNYGPEIRFKSHSLTDSASVYEGDTILLAIVVKEGTTPLNTFSVYVGDTLFASNAMEHEVWENEYKIPTYKTGFVEIDLEAAAEENLSARSHLSVRVDTSVFRTQSAVFYSMTNDTANQLDTVGWDLRVDTAVYASSVDKAKYIVSSQTEGEFSGEFTSYAGLSFCLAHSLLNFDSITQVQMKQSYQGECLTTVHPSESEIYVTKIRDKYCAIRIDSLKTGEGLWFTYKTTTSSKP